MAKDKEPNFFNNDRTFLLLGEYYRPLFEKGIGYPYRGEASGAYMSSAKAIERIKKWTHAPVFIFILRNPVDRAISHYYYQQGRGLEQREFSISFQESIDILPDEDTFSPAYYAEGCYGRWLQNYFDTFGEKNIHIITTEALKNQPQEVVNSCFSFLKVSPLPGLVIPVLNQTTVLKNPRVYKNTIELLSDKRSGMLKSWYQKTFSDRSRITIRRGLMRLLEFSKDNLLASQKPTVVDEATRAWVADFYREDVQHLKKLTNHSFYAWKEFC